MDPALIHNIILFLSVVCQYPVAIVARKLPPKIRPVFNAVIGLIICFTLYHTSFIIVVIGAIFCWVLLHLPGRLCLLTNIIPIIGLLWIHLLRLRQVTEWGSDLSGLIMFTSLRIWMTTFNVFDGRTQNLPREQWKITAIPIPSLLDYMLYLFNFAGIYTGPVYPYCHYKQMISFDGEIADAFKPWLVSTAIGTVYGLLIGFFPASEILSESFNNKNYLFKLLYSIFFSYLHTSRYIFAWSGAEAANKVLGLGSVPNVDFEEYRALRQEKYLSLRKVSELPNEWNHTVHIILKEYLHIRLVILGVPQQIAKLLTFCSSAFWHGLFPGYYMYAAMVSIVSILDNLRFKLFTPIVASIVGDKGAHVFDSVWIHAINFYMGAPWDLLWANCYVEFNVNMKFIPYILLAVMVCIGFVVNGLKPMNKKQAKTE